ELLEEPRKAAHRAFLATDGDTLREIYKQIDELERSEIGRIEFRSYDERFHVFLVPGFLFALLALLLSETLLRRVP
ncbi:MAG: aerotolerance regulator BatA, partial [Planctomycetota bacterium]